MDLITPNKEIIRRICILNGGTTCCISRSNNNEFIELLVDIKEDQLKKFTYELTEWTGANYKAYNTSSNAFKAGALSHIKETILPININL
ncbi:MAG TPA: hypothetical protein EYG68_00885 [Leucothrix mucor]|nr:hypothetical protein [Leucothrix mucor]